MNNPFSIVKQKVSILDIISQHITLKKIGHYWKGQCPFHSEKTASFTVSPHKEIFYCFGCQAGGDAVSFVCKIENCSPFEAVKQLADRYNITLPDTFSHEFSTHNLDKKKRFFALCHLVAQWAHKQLLQSPEILMYFSLRKISTNSINQFTLGYFPEGNRPLKELIRIANAQNFLLEDLVEAGIMNEGKDVYSPFEGRILFPIKDHLGNYCGFGGRIVHAHDQRSKYYNSKESPFFQKGSILFGLDAAKKEIQKTGTVFLVEGYTDCIALFEHGYQNVVATLGTACTSEHLKLLSHHAHTLYVLYDSDSAGQKATLRLAQMCWEVNLDVKVITLSDVKDPAHFFEKQTNLQPYIDQAQDILHFFLTSLGQDYASKPLTLKLQATRSFLEVIKKLQDPLKREILLQQAAQRFDLPLATLKQELGTVLQPQRKPLSQKVESLSSHELSSLEKNFIYAILNKIDLFQNRQVKDLLEYLPEPFKGIMSKMQSMLAQTDDLQTISTLFDALQEEEKIALSQILFTQEQEPTDDIDQIVLLLEKKYWKKIVITTQQRLSYAQQSQDFDRAKHIIGSFLELKKRLLHKGLI